MQSSSGLPSLSSDSLESDIIARVEAAENKIYLPFTYGRDSVYDGQIEGGKRYGYGTFIDKQGNKYVGEWKNDNMNGNGTYTWASGSKYVGEWKNNKKHGQGTYTYASGTIHPSGEWVNNKPIVSFKKIFVFVISYIKVILLLSSFLKISFIISFYIPQTKDESAERKFQKSEKKQSDIIARVEAAENKITKDYGSGNVYYGQMEGGKFHGYGTYTRTNGTIGWKYVGEYKNGNMHGQGTYTRANGTIWHSGEWVNDRRKI